MVEREEQEELWQEEQNEQEEQEKEREAVKKTRTRRGGDSLSTALDGQRQGGRIQRRP